jgi:hypothetical protein
VGTAHSSLYLGRIRQAANILVGQSFAVLSDGIFNMQGDLKSAFGGEALQKIYRLRKSPAT